VLKKTPIGRSHRHKICKEKLNEVIIKSKKILQLPDLYVVGIMTGSNTGALEAALWSLLGCKGVDVLAWENFGKDWAIDVLEQLKIKDVNSHITDYGILPDLSRVNFNNDVVFTWNGTTAGVKIPNGDWIPENREGLTICDATSGIFAMDIDYSKLDVITWSWQKVLGAEAAHGMITLSPRAVQRLETYVPSWPIPKLFRLASKKKLIKGIFEGGTINTPSMICVEDALDALNWVESVGGTKELVKISNENLKIVEDWVSKNDYFKFMCEDKNTRSSTSITLLIKDEWFNKFNEEDQREILKKLFSLLEKEGVANDINGYPKAPPSIRIWGGSTVQNGDMKALLPWIDWAYNSVKDNA
jgi:phosphoserine aminotransferase